MSYAKRSLVTGGIALVLALGIRPGLLLADDATPTAKSSTDEANQLEDVIVTAEKAATGRSVQKVPIAITAVDANFIADNNIQDAQDIGRIAPNVQLDTTGSGRDQAGYTIRGVGSSTGVASVDPAVSIAQDGMYIHLQAGAALSTFDTQSVEILRGPQGVLQGINSAGGAVLFTTPLPNGEAHQSGLVTFGNFGEADFQGSVEGTLAENVFGKVAIYYKHNNGMYQNTNDGTFVPAPDNPSGLAPQHPSGLISGTNDVIIKPTFQFILSDNLRLKLFTQFENLNDGGTPTENISPTINGLETMFGYSPSTRPYTTNISVTGFNRINEEHVITELDWNVAGGTSTTIAAYRVLNFGSLFNNGGSPFNLLILPGSEENHQFSVESRYNGNITDNLAYVAGVYIFDDTIGDTSDSIYNAALLGGSYLDTIDKFNKWNQSDSIDAVFANLDWTVIQNLTLSAGLRYQYQFKSMHDIPNGTCTGPDFTGCPSTFYDGAKTYYATTPRFVASYQLTPDIMTYISYAKGFSAGDYNGSAPTPAAAVVPTQPETVTSYEVGLKSQWFDRRFRANIALFDSDFANIERTVNQSIDNQLVQTLTNAASATIKGAEVELSALPLDGLRLNLSSGFTDAAYRTFTGLPPGLNGEELQFAEVPKWTYDVGGSYTFGVPGVNGQFSFNTDYAWRSLVNTNVLNIPQEIQRAFGLLNATFAYNTGPWHFALFGRNLQNTFYAETVGETVSWMDWGGIPRTFGVEFGFKH